METKSLSELQRVVSKKIPLTLSLSPVGRGEGEGAEHPVFHNVYHFFFHQSLHDFIKSVDPLC